MLFIHTQIYVYTAEGIEFWYARDLQILLGYRKRDKLQDSNLQSQGNLFQCRADCRGKHFADVGKMVSLCSGFEREIPYMMLARNGDLFLPVSL